MSWWSLGEGVGYRGTSLEVHRITCPFCGQSGNFSLAYHAEKVKANAAKQLNFDTLRCENCAGYVMCLWSASEHGWGGYDYKVLPWPVRVDSHPEEWPEHVGRYWIQAHRCLSDENWDAAVVMARSALQIAAREHGAVGRNLAQEIDSLAEGKLPPVMKDWAHEVRDIGNEAAHPTPTGAPTTSQDARDIVSFLDQFLEYLYTLPARIESYRARRAEQENEA